MSFNLLTTHLEYFTTQDKTYKSDNNNNFHKPTRLFVRYK